MKPLSEFKIDENGNLKIIVEELFFKLFLYIMALFAKYPYMQDFSC